MRVDEDNKNKRKQGRLAKFGSFKELFWEEHWFYYFGTYFWCWRGYNVG